MNVVQIVCDTFRRDHLGAYGNPWIRTPNLDRLAGESVVFDRAHTGSFPTLPHRNDLFTGRYAFRKYSWEALPAAETPLSAVMSAAGVKTQLIHDTPHVASEGHNYGRGFDGWEWIRGQEDEPYRSFPRHPKPPEPKAKYQEMDQYLRNVSDRRGEADYFPAKTAAATTPCLKQNAHDGPFFLHVDFFVPHEPFDPPMSYARAYPHDRRAAFIKNPLRGLADVFTAAEIKNIRALYAGEVTLVDKYVGRILAAIDRLGLRKNTAVVFTTDHGFYLGDHGIVGKFVPHRGGKGVEQAHYYEEVAAIPCMIRAPGVRARRSGALVQPVDLSATTLELAGLTRTQGSKVSRAARLFPAASVLTAAGRKGASATGFDLRKVNGRSLVPLLFGRTDAHRSIAVTGYSLKFHSPIRARAAITDGEWTLHYAGRYGDGKQGTLFPEVFAKRTGGYRGETTPVLVHLQSDPAQDENLLAAGARMPAGVRVDPWAKAKSLHAAYVKFLEAIETPEENLAPRRWFPKQP